MSLILHTTCQPHLNDHGLGNYHIRINNNHNLTKLKNRKNISQPN